MAKDPFESLPTIKVNPTTGKDPFDSLPVVHQVTQPDQGFSPLESAGLGAIQGATLGYGDEAEGALRAGTDALAGKNLNQSLTDLYTKYRDLARQRNELAEKQNPKSYFAGQLGGGAATAFVPGLGELNLGKAAAVGAAAGLGSSNADLTKGEIGKAALDTGIGAGIGAASYGVTKGIQSLLSPEARQLAAQKSAVRAIGGKPIITGPKQNLQVGQAVLENNALPLFGGSEATLDAIKSAQEAAEERVNPLIEKTSQLAQEQYVPEEKAYQVANQLHDADKAEFEKAMQSYTNQATKAASQGASEEQPNLPGLIDNLEQTNTPEINPDSTQEAFPEIKDYQQTPVTNEEGSQNQLEMLLHPEKPVEPTAPELPQSLVDKESFLNSLDNTLSDQLSKLPAPDAQRLEQTLTPDLDKIKAEISAAGNDPLKLLDIRRKYTSAANVFKADGNINPDLRPKAELYNNVALSLQNRIEQMANQLSLNLGQDIRSANQNWYNLIRAGNIAEKTVNQDAARSPSNLKLREIAAGGLFGPKGLLAVGAKKTGEAITGNPITRSISNLNAKMNYGLSKALQTNLGEVATDVVPKSVQGAIASVGVQNKVQSLYTAKPQYLQNVSSSLQQNDSTKNLGLALQNAVQSNDNNAKNAAIFAIMQNPNARALMPEYGDNNGQ